MCQCIYTYTCMLCIMYSMHIHLYLYDIHTWQHDGDSLRFSEFPRISETVERKPYTSGRYYLGIANHFIRFPRMDARPFYWCGFREVFWLKSHASSLGSWLLSLNQPVHACHRSSFPQRFYGTTPPFFGSLEPQTQESSGLSVDFRIHFDCSPCSLLVPHPFFS